MSKLSKFFRLTAAERFLLSEAILLTGFARLAVVTLPFRWIAPALGQQQNNAAIIDDCGIVSSELQLIRIAWAVRRVSRYTPWRSNCLAKAVAGKYMLRRRQIPSTLYFGLTKNSQGQFEAHAWLRCGDRIITGGSDLDRYAVVATFID